MMLLLAECAAILIDLYGYVNYFLTLLYLLARFLSRIQDTGRWLARATQASRMSGTGGTGTGSGSR